MAAGGTAEMAGEHRGGGATYRGPDGSGEMQRFFADVEDLLGRVRNVAGEEMERARSRLQESMASARQAAGRQSERARAATRAAADSADEYAHTNPWIVVGIAAAAGIVLGALFTRR